MTRAPEARALLIPLRDVSPRAVALSVLPVHAIFALALLAFHGFDFSAFIHAGERFVSIAGAPPGLSTVLPGDGYDGQFFYRLALDPFTSDETASGITLDLPAYRQQRILYPLLVWAVSFGWGRAMPLVMVAVNLAAIAALAWAGAHLFRSYGRSVWWGAALACCPGFLVSLSANLSEIVAAALLTGAILAIRRRRPWPGMLGLLAAGLTQETAWTPVIAAGLVGLASVGEPADDDHVPWYVSVVPIGIFVIWQIVLAQRWGVAPIRASMEFQGIPLLGVLTAMHNLRSLSSPLQWITLIEILAAGFFIGMVTLCLPTSAAPRFVCLAWVLTMVVALMGTVAVWESDLTFWRALTEVYVLGMLVLGVSQTRWRRAPVAVLTCAWLAFAIRIVWAAAHGPESA